MVDWLLGSFGHPEQVFIGPKPKQTETNRCEMVSTSFVVSSVKKMPHLPRRHFFLKETRAPTHTHTRTSTHSQQHTLIPTHTRTLSLSLSLSLPLWWTTFIMYSHTNRNVLTYNTQTYITLTLTFSHSHTPILSRTHEHKHSLILEVCLKMLSFKSRLMLSRFSAWKHKSLKKVQGFYVVNNWFRKTFNKNQPDWLRTSHWQSIS